MTQLLASMGGVEVVFKQLSSEEDKLWFAELLRKNTNKEAMKMMLDQLMSVSPDFVMNYLPDQMIAHKAKMMRTSMSLEVRMTYVQNCIQINPILLANKLSRILPPAEIDVHLPALTDLADCILAELNFRKSELNPRDTLQLSDAIKQIKKVKEILEAGSLSQISLRKLKTELQALRENHTLSSEERSRVFVDLFKNVRICTTLDPLNQKAKTKLIQLIRNNADLDGIGEVIAELMGIEPNFVIKFFPDLLIASHANTMARTMNVHLRMRIATQCLQQSPQTLAKALLNLFSIEEQKKYLNEMIVFRNDLMRLLRVSSADIDILAKNYDPVGICLKSLETVISEIEFSSHLEAVISTPRISEEEMSRSEIENFDFSNDEALLPLEALETFISNFRDKFTREEQNVRENVVDMISVVNGWLTTVSHELTKSKKQNVPDVTYDLEHIEHSLRKFNRKLSRMEYVLARQEKYSGAQSSTPSRSNEIISNDRKKKHFYHDTTAIILENPTLHEEYRTQVQGVAENVKAILAKHMNQPAATDDTTTRKDRAAAALINVAAAMFYNLAFVEINQPLIDSWQDGTIFERLAGTDDINWLLSLWEDPNTRMHLQELGMKSVYSKLPVETLKASWLKFKSESKSRAASSSSSTPDTE